MVKIDLKTERTLQQWQTLLDTIKRNDNNILTRDEQQFYIENIEHKLGIRNKNLEVLRQIEESKADPIKFD